jgi:hypothetical protein
MTRARLINIALFLMLPVNWMSRSLSRWRPRSRSSRWRQSV